MEIKTVNALLNGTARVRITEHVTYFDVVYLASDGTTVLDFVVAEKDDRIGRNIEELIQKSGAAGFTLTLVD